MRESSGSRDETLLWAMGTFASDSPQEFVVPVDSTVRRVTFSMSVDTSGSDFTVIDPAGSVVAASDNRTDITVLNCGRIVTVDTPAAGAWRLRAAGVGRFWVTTHARTELSIVTAEFVRPGGRPGHEGLFRINGQPLAGAPATVRVVVSREHVASASFDLVSQHGQVIQEVRLKPEATDDADEFVATFDLPGKPFRIRVTGADSAGHPYQRVFHTLFHAETVEVVPPNPVDDVAPGASLAIPFTIRNGGAATTFRVVAADGRRMITRFEPSTLALDPGTAAIVTVWIAVPADAAPGTGTDVTVTATSESAPRTSNGATFHVSVAAR